MKAEPVKVKNITIRIRDLKEALDEAKEVMKKLERGKKVEKHDGITFESLEAMRKVLTGERLKILKTRRLSERNAPPRSMSWQSSWAATERTRSTTFNIWRRSALSI